MGREDKSILKYCVSFRRTHQVSYRLYDIPFDGKNPKWHGLSSLSFWACLSTWSYVPIMGALSVSQSVSEFGDMFIYSGSSAGANPTETIETERAEMFPLC